MFHFAKLHGIQLQWPTYSLFISCGLQRTRVQ